jgi:hypothetical protein
LAVVKKLKNALFPQGTVPTAENIDNIFVIFDESNKGTLNRQ